MDVTKKYMEKVPNIWNFQFGMSSHVLLSIFKTVKTAVYVYGKSPKYMEFSHGHKHLNFTKKKKILVQLYTLFGVSDANKRRKESQWKMFFGRF